MNKVSNDVVKYTPAKSDKGPMLPSEATSMWDSIAEAPVFSKATDIGNMAAMSTTLSQLMVL